VITTNNFERATNFLYGSSNFIEQIDKYKKQDLLNFAEVNLNFSYLHVLSKIRPVFFNNYDYLYPVSSYAVATVPDSDSISCKRLVVYLFTDSTLLNSKPITWADAHLHLCLNYASYTASIVVIKDDEILPVKDFDIKEGKVIVYQQLKSKGRL